jgi:hypothetical protein
VEGRIRKRGGGGIKVLVSERDRQVPGRSS